MEFESVRELSISCKKQGINLGTLTSCIRLKNHIDQIESLIASIAHSPEPERLIDIANQIAQISMSESISPGELGNRIKQQQEERQRLEEEIKQRRAILESANVDIQTLNEYKKLKEELYVHGLSLKDPRILLSILNTIREIGYEPQKIVREVSPLTKIPINIIITTNPIIRFRVTNLDNFTSAIVNIEIE